MASELYHVTEFYRSGEKLPFCRRSSILAHPSVGDQLDVSGVAGKIVAVNWNLDYCGRPDEQWRCNIFIKTPTETKQ
jgi:hypothetical protein